MTVYFGDPDTPDDWVEGGLITSDGIDLGEELEAGEYTAIPSTLTETITMTLKTDNIDLYEYRRMLWLLFGVMFIPGVKHLYTIGGDDDDRT